MAEAQLPLPMPSEPEQRFDTFVDAPPGLLPWLAAFALGEETAATGFLQGPVGSGKTHLLLAACAHAREAGRNAGYLPLARAAGRADEALQALERHDLVALDDLDGFVGDAAAERALFHFHNRAVQSGTRLLYAAASAPAGLPIDLPDLRSRLAQCTRMTVAQLDDQGRARMLQTRAARRGLVLEPAAIEWLLRRVGRDPAGLAAMLARLDTASLAAQRRITVPFLRGVLAVDVVDANMAADSGQGDA